MTGEDPGITRRTSLRKSSTGSTNPLQRKLSWKDSHSSRSRFPSLSPNLPLEGDAAASPSSNQISDQRSAPSQSDHDYIVNSLMHGLDNVDQVIIYDTPHEPEAEENKVEVLFWRRALSKLHQIWISLCDCHAGL